MPPRRPPRPAPPEVDALRTALQHGKIVRVGIAPSDQFPDGVTGRVRRIGDPAVDGEEFIFVEVPVGGAKDVLPFAAADLIGSPGRARVAATVPGATPRGRRPSQTSPSGPTELVASPPPVDPPLFASGPAGPDGTAGDPDEQVSTRQPAIRTSRRPAAVAKGPAAARGKRPPVTITISTTGDTSSIWRIEARIGAKPAVRPTVVPPSRVWDIVESLGDPKLTEVVRSLLDDHRRSTQARADALATQLFELQEELKSFPDKDSR